MTPSGEARSTSLALRVRPGARRNEVRWDPGRSSWIVAVAAPAVNGAANRALLLFLAECLGVPPERLRIERGSASRSKSIAVVGLTGEEVRDRLRRTAGPP